MGFLKKVKKVAKDTANAVGKVVKKVDEVIPTPLIDIDINIGNKDKDKDDGKEKKPAGS